MVQSGQGQCPKGDGLQETVGTAHGSDDDVQDEGKVQEQMVALSVIISYIGIDSKLVLYSKKHRNRR